MTRRGAHPWPPGQNCAVVSGIACQAACLASPQALEDKLEKVVRLFSYLSDKDIFAEFYKKQLAKRLLLARSSSDDAERSMIAKLKLRCGAQACSPRPCTTETFPHKMSAGTRPAVHLQARGNGDGHESFERHADGVFRAPE